MQVKDQTVIHRNKYSLLSTLLKVGVTLVCLYFLWVQFREEEAELAKVTFTRSISWTLVAVTVLMIINWYLEALRWKLSLAPFEKISMREAWSAVLGGLALNWVLPFTGGDFTARLIMRRDKYQTISAVILNRSIMLAITLGFGIFSLGYLKQSYFQISSIYLLLIIALVIAGYFLRKKLIRFLNYFQTIKKGELFRIISISILRYAIFTFQFYWLLAAFNPAVKPMLLFAGVGWIFLVRSIIPHLLGGVGLRETAGVIFFASYVSDMSSILFPVFLIWVINTVAPSIAGLVLIWKTKWRNFSNN